MKKILSWLILLILLATPTLSFGAACVSQGSGNWSATATWGTSCHDPASIPLAGDSVEIANGHTVVWDVANGVRIPATSGSLTTITGTGTGTITIDPSDDACHTSGTCQINFTTAQAGTEHLFQITGTTDHDVTFNGTSITASPATSAKHGIYHNSAGGHVKVNAALVGSSGASGCGMRLNGSGSLATVAGNITGGGANTAYGVYVGVSSTQVLTVSSGTVTGGSAANAPALWNTYANPSTVVIASGVKLANSTQSGAIGGVFTWNAGAGDYWTIAGTVTRVAKEVAAGDLKKDVVNGSVTGTLEAGGSGGGAWGF